MKSSSPSKSLFADPQPGASMLSDDTSAQAPYADFKWPTLGKDKRLDWSLFKPIYRSDLEANTKAQSNQSAAEKPSSTASIKDCYETRSAETAMPQSADSKHIIEPTPVALVEQRKVAVDESATIADAITDKFDRSPRKTFAAQSSSRTVGIKVLSTQTKRQSVWDPGVIKHVVGDERRIDWSSFKAVYPSDSE